MLAVILLASCSNNDDPVVPQPADDVEEELAKMTLTEKVGQMFYTRLESLDTTFHWNTYDDLQVNPMIEVNTTIKDVNSKYPVGGIILYAWNIDDESQLASLIADIRTFNGSPLLCIDEEGGRIARIANNPKFNVKKYESMEAIGQTGDPANAYECGNTIGTYLKHYGFDIDFAPVADVNTNPENIIIGKRAFSDDPQVAAPMVTNYLQGLKDAGITGCIKHFPGHGDTKADTHYGYARSMKTWSDIPSTMSPIILQDKLREELGYQNIIITDGMEMGSITQQYSSGEAAVASILAGVDIVLGPKDFVKAFDAVIKAVENGTISEERINQSVRRILKLKKQA